MILKIKMAGDFINTWLASVAFKFIRLKHSCTPVRIYVKKWYRKKKKLNWHDVSYVRSLTTNEWLKKSKDISRFISLLYVTEINYRTRKDITLKMLLIFSFILVWNSANNKNMFSILTFLKKHFELQITQFFENIRACKFVQRA